MDKPKCPVTGKSMQRGVRQMTISYQGLSETIDMPGWYAEGSDESVHSGEDMKISDQALENLKYQLTCNSRGLKNQSKASPAQLGAIDNINADAVAVAKRFGNR